MPSALPQHVLGQERVGPQRSIRIDVFAINRVAICRVRRRDGRSDLIACRVLRRSSWVIERLADRPRFGAFRQFLALERPDRQEAASNATRHPPSPVLLNRWRQQICSAYRHRAISQLYRFEPTDRRHTNGRKRRVSLLAVRRGEGRLAEPDRSRSPFAPTQVDGLKIGSDTGTCFKVRV